jgi:hypothetical protein
MWCYARKSCQEILIILHHTPAWKTVNKEAELTKTNQENYCFVIQNEPDASAFGGGAWATIK